VSGALHAAMAEVARATAAAITRCAIMLFQSSSACGGSLAHGGKALEGAEFYAQVLAFSTSL
jgi:hypothetical protein